MKVFELINFSRELLMKLRAAGVRLDDVRYVDLYADYTSMRRDECKVSYIVAVLAERYGVSERKFEEVRERLYGDCSVIVQAGSFARAGGAIFE